jgi:hypothetical protein
MVQHFKYKDLDGKEIEQLTGREPILYSTLGKYKSLNQLLGKYNFVVLLLQTSNISTGHFVAITKPDGDGKFRYFDSYGFSPLTEIQEYVPFDNKHYPNYLPALFKNVEWEHNSIDYQSKKSGRNGEVSTCGRWSSIACKFRNIPLPAISTLFKTNASAFLQDTDNTACLLTMLTLRNVPEYLDDLKSLQRN